MSACECDKDCEREYLKDCTCKKSFVDDIIVTYYETANTPETTSINSNGETILITISEFVYDGRVANTLIRTYIYILRKLLFSYQNLYDKTRFDVVNRLV